MIELLVGFRNEVSGANKTQSNQTTTEMIIEGPKPHA